MLLFIVYLFMKVFFYFFNYREKRKPKMWWIIMNSTMRKVLSPGGSKNIAIAKQKTVSISHRGDMILVFKFSHLSSQSLFAYSSPGVSLLCKCRYYGGNCLYIPPNMRNHYLISSSRNYNFSIFSQWRKIWILHLSNAWKCF